MPNAELEKSLSPSEAARLGDDLLVGADAIARELNWKTSAGKWHRRRVYHLAEHGRLPIHRVKGLGIVARRSALRAYFASLDVGLFAPREDTRASPSDPS